MLAQDDPETFARESFRSWWTIVVFWTAIIAGIAQRFGALTIPATYMYLLFYGLADIHSFQTTRKMPPDYDAMFHVTGFDRFIFERNALPPDQPFTFVTRSSRLPCDHPEIATSGPVRSSGRCRFF